MLVIKVGWSTVNFPRQTHLFPMGKWIFAGFDASADNTFEDFDGTKKDKQVKNQACLG